MKLKIRYENTFQTLDVDLEEMWVMLSLAGEEGMSEQAREKLVQQAMDEQFNRPEYNNYHKFTRHRDEKAVPKRLDGKKAYLTPHDEGGIVENPKDIESFPDCRSEEEIRAFEDYEDVSRKLNDAMPERQANLLLRIHVDGVRVSDYARAEGVTRSAISHRLETAEKNFKKVFPRPSTFRSSRGN